MAQHLNNQMHQMTNLGMLQGLNFTILNNNQAHLGQFAQPGHQGMYQIVQQVPGQHQVQLQNVQHLNQFNNQFHHMQPQQFNQQLQQSNILQLQQQASPQLTQQIQATQQIQQPQQNHQAVQQQQQTPTNNKTKGKNKKNNNNSVKEEPPIKMKSTKKKKNQPVVNKDGKPAPKRATTAYINFTQYYREQMKKNGRTVPKIGEFGKECAAKWNSMTEEEKRPFTDNAERDRERYRKEMEAFKPAKDTLKPKRPGTAFMLFMVDFRKEIAGKEPEGGVAATAKLGGERWRNMTDEEKKPYVDQQSQQKLAYEKRMEEYRLQTGQPAGKSNASKAKSINIKSEDSNASEHLNNSLSNSNISNNVDHLNNHDEHHSQSPSSTSSQTANNLAQTMSSDLSNVTTLSLQAQPFYSTANSFMSAAFLDQHEDASYSQTIDQQIHDGQNQEQNDQQAYLHNGQQTYQHYWN